ncbi:MAG: thioesterase family protein [Ilumatobacteraceae bacterium]
MGFDFDDAIAATAVNDDQFDASVHGGWDIRGVANGGYVLAMVGSAMRQAAQGREPNTITAHYLAPLSAGGVVINTEVIKRGKRLTTVLATVRQGDRDAVRAIGAFGEIPDPTDGLVHIAGAPPSLPSFVDCAPRNSGIGDFPVALMDHVDVRLHPDDAGFARGQVSGRAMVRGWFSFPDRRPIDALAILLATDSFPPALFNLTGSPGWVPTIELTAHIRAQPAPGPLRCIFTSRFVQGGMFEEDGELWDARGVLVGQSRQLGLVPRT